MKPIANITGIAPNLSRLTPEQIERAIARANKPPTVKQAIKAGYKLEWLMPSLQGKVGAAIAGRTIQPLPRFVKKDVWELAREALDAAPVPMTGRKLLPEGWQHPAQG